MDSASASGLTLWLYRVTGFYAATVFAIAVYNFEVAPGSAGQRRHLEAAIAVLAIGFSLAGARNLGYVGGSGFVLIFSALLIFGGQSIVLYVVHGAYRRMRERVGSF